MNTSFTLRTCGAAVLSALALLGSILPVRAATYEPIAPPIRTEEREHFVRCASGAVQTHLQARRTLVLPAQNYTQVLTLQAVFDDAFTKAVGDLSLTAYPVTGGFNTAAADPVLYDNVVRGEITVVDRATHSDELKKEFGVDFGKGFGSSFLGVPNTEKWTVGWVTAVVNFFKPEIRPNIFQKNVTAMHVRASATARAAFFTLGNSDGVNASIVVTYGNQYTVEKQAGMQRAALAALRAATSRAAMELAGVEPRVCNL